jgi:small redox-active disulfide protein 2
MKQIEVLGPGCANCKKAAEEVKKALDSIGWKEGQNYTLTKVQNIQEIAARGVLMTPSVAVDGKIVSSGKVPKAGEVISWMK